MTTLSDFLEIVRQTKAANISGILMRFESEVLDDNVSDTRALKRLGLVRSNRDPGSKSTIFVDLSAGEEEILGSFNQSCRRNIRKAQQAGVQVERVDPTDSNLRSMFELMKETEARANYGLRPKLYFESYWSQQIKAGQGQLLFARHESDLLAGVFLTYLGVRAWYKDGGSRSIKRELQASYLIQWESMRWLKSQGVKRYDLVGVPNRDQVGTGDERDGLYSFKAKFNPEITEFIGCWDLPLHSQKYRFWLKFGERVAAKLASRRPEKFLY